MEALGFEVMHVYGLTETYGHVSQCAWNDEWNSLDEDKKNEIKARQGQRTAEFWNFSNAKTLVLFCNGVWCGQAPTNIKSLLRIGYPPSKLKWYRGGMQNWEVLGLTSIKPN